VISLAPLKVSTRNKIKMVKNLSGAKKEQRKKQRKNQIEEETTEKTKGKQK